MTLSSWILTSVQQDKNKRLSTSACHFPAGEVPGPTPYLALYTVRVATGQGKVRKFFFQGQGKVREFCLWSGNFDKTTQSQGKVREFHVTLTHHYPHLNVAITANEYN